ncbi:MAG: hypothetical protein IPK16_20745 [Anaerolineales bacterium]|nr:hypothetical protein [Anaerolineales bacterium]
MPATVYGPSLVIALLAIRPGWWCNALTAYLQAFPQLRIVAAPLKLDEILVMLDTTSAQTLVLEATVCTPHLPFALQVLHTTHPDLNIVIIADTLGEYQMAEQGGVDTVLLKSNLLGALDPAIFL